MLKYHIDGTRDTLLAIIAMRESICSAGHHQKTISITDDNVSYPAGSHFINQAYETNLTPSKIIELQNLEPESEEFRPLMERIERFNRAYNFRTRAVCGFDSKNGT